ncbi:chemotaxis protein, partial [Pseudomonas syringae pv. tagetis]
NYDPCVRRWYKTSMAIAGMTFRRDAYYWAKDDLVVVSSIRAIPYKLGNPRGVVNIDVWLELLPEGVKLLNLGDSGYRMLEEKIGT